MSDKDIESEIQAKGLTAPRVTPNHIESIIASEHYFTGSDGVLGAYKNNDDVYVGSAPSDKSVRSLDLITFCVLVLQNGFTVTGESACASRKTSTRRSGVRLPARMRWRRSGRWKAIC